jgi:archaellum component FlaC
MEGVIALFIPILALSIPIVAIVSRSRRAQTTSSPQADRQIELLKERIETLEESLEHVTTDLHSLEDNQRFLTRLLEDKQTK